MAWDIPLFSWGELSQLCPLPFPYLPQPTSLEDSVRKRESLDTVSTVQQLPKQCVVNPVLVTNPKDSIIGAAMRKANSIPVQTSATGLKEWD